MQCVETVQTRVGRLSESHSLFHNRLSQLFFNFLVKYHFWTVFVQHLHLFKDGSLIMLSEMLLKLLSCRQQSISSLLVILQRSSEYLNILALSSFLVYGIYPEGTAASWYPKPSKDPLPWRVTSINFYLAAVCIFHWNLISVSIAM
jgi:hypothetical protein